MWLRTTACAELKFIIQAGQIIYFTFPVRKMLDVSFVIAPVSDSLLIIVTGSKKKTGWVLIRYFTESHSILKVHKRAVRAGGWQRSLVCLGQGSSFDGLLLLFLFIVNWTKDILFWGATSRGCAWGSDGYTLKLHILKDYYVSSFSRWSLELLLPKYCCIA